MDKFEYKLKLDELKSLTAQGKYQEAAEIADSINWHKIKNVYDLMKAGEIYEKVERYEESREILLMAYDRTPIGRTIIYRLAELAVRMGRFDEAEDYYQEFVNIAPHDNLRYVLRYEIGRATGVDIHALIEILEELKTQEYSEEWAYELVTLYRQAGMEEKCIDACDELILWFGEGDYVERALEVKMAYGRLTEAQALKYRRLQQKKGIAVSGEVQTQTVAESENRQTAAYQNVFDFGRQTEPETVAAPTGLAEDEKRFAPIQLADPEKESVVEVRPGEMLESGEIVNNTVKIPNVRLSSDRFNTQSLQDIVKFGMRTIRGATREDDISTGMAMIKQAVEEVPNMHITSDLPRVERSEVSAAEVYAENHPDYNQMLAEDPQGQFSFVVPEQRMIERQITGQISIGDLLEEWEHAQEEAKQRNLKAAKEQAIRDVVDIMGQLSEVLPVLDSGMTPQDLLQQYQEGDEVEDEKAAAFVAQMNQLLQQQMEEISHDTAVMQEEISQARPAKAEEPPVSPAPEEPLPQEMSALAEELPDIAADDGPAAGETQGMDGEAPSGGPAEASKKQGRQQTKIFPQVEKEAPKTVEGAEGQQIEEAILREAMKSMEAMNATAPTQKMPKVGQADSFRPIKELSKPQREIFTYFVSIKGMEAQICQALNGMGGRLAAGQAAVTGNLMIRGDSGSGKTVLATAMIRALQQMFNRPSGKVGKIEASVLNQRDVAALIKKVAGGCLIIEKAGDISVKTANELAALLAGDESGLLLMVEDTHKGVEKFLSLNPALAQCFTERINIPAFTSDELVSFAKAYANELGYKIDELGVLALYNSISNIQKLDHATTLTEVKDIVDEAIRHVEKGGVKKLLSIITSQRYDDEDYVILHEKDFGF